MKINNQKRLISRRKIEKKIKPFSVLSVLVLKNRPERKIEQNAAFRIRTFYFTVLTVFVMWNWPRTVFWRSFVLPAFCSRKFKFWLRTELLHLWAKSSNFIVQFVKNALNIACSKWLDNLLFVFDIVHLPYHMVHMTSL